MKLFDSNKPKQAIKRILLFIAYLFFTLTIMILIFAFEWIYSPNTIKDIDKEIPEYYSLEINALTQQIDDALTQEEKLQANYKLLNSLKDISDYDRYITIKSNTYHNIIHILKTKGYHSLALEYATQWNKELPNDINSYIDKTDVLKQIDMKEAETFIKNANYKFYDISKLHNYYLGFLYAQKQYNKILIEEEKFEKSKIEKLEFIIYYTTKESPKFSEEKIIPIKNNMLKHTNNEYTLSFKQEIKNLRKIRVVILHNDGNEVLKGIDLKIQDNNSISIEKNLQDFQAFKTEQTNPNIIILANEKPYFDLALDKALDNLLSFNIKISLHDNLSIFVKKSLQSEKQNILSYANDKNEAFYYILNQIKIENNNLIYSQNIKATKLKLLNFEVKNRALLAYKSIKLKINSKLVSEDSYQLIYNHIKPNNLNYYTISGHKPYIQFILKSPLITDKIEIILSGENQ